MPIYYITYSSFCLERDQKEEEKDVARLESCTHHVGILALTGILAQI